jgi:hypothetical protein
LKAKLEAHFHVINLSEGGAKLTNVITEQIEIAMRSHPGPNQVYVIEFGSNNMRKTTRPALEVAKIVSRYRRIMTEAQRAKVRVLLCGTIPDPRPAVDSKLKLLDEALKDLEMGEGNKFLSLRGSLLDAQGAVRKDIFKPRGDIHLNVAGNQIVSLRIRKMLEVMLPNLVPVQTSPAPVQTPPAPAPALVQAPVQTPSAKVQRTRVLAPVPDPAPVAVNTPVVGAPLVAVVNAPEVVQAPVVESQDQVETPMETDEDEILARLFFKKYGRELPEKEKENDVDNIKFVIDLTDDTEEMEVATPIVVVKTEPIEAPENVANVTNADKVAADRKERRELVKARKALIAFGKTLRKSVQIPEKEAPEVVADSNVSVDTSVNPVEPVTVRTAEQAEMDADEKEFAAEFGDVPLDEFDNTGSGFRLYGPEDVLPSDDEDTMIDDV